MTEKVLRPWRNRRPIITRRLTTTVTTAAMRWASDASERIEPWVEKRSTGKIMAILKNGFKLSILFHSGKSEISKGKYFTILESDKFPEKIQSMIISSLSTRTKGYGWIYQIFRILNLQNKFICIVHTFLIFELHL